MTDPSWAGFLKATIAGLLFLLPLSGRAPLQPRHAVCRKGGPSDFGIPDARQGGRSGGRRGPCGTDVGFSFSRRRFCCAHRLGRNLMRWSENSFLGGLPQYRLVKSVAEGLAQIENAEDLKPASSISRTDGRLAISLRLAEGLGCGFLPQAPTPMSGNVMYLPAERVRLLSNHDG